MLLAKLTSPVKAVANARSAPGATSWTIWAIARPSSAAGSDAGVGGVVEHLDRRRSPAGIARAGQITGSDVIRRVEADGLVS